jgi:hypothetical protein
MASHDGLVTPRLINVRTLARTAAFTALSCMTLQCNALRMGHMWKNTYNKFIWPKIH